jgi:FimV-like protein
VVLLVSWILMRLVFGRPQSPARRVQSPSPAPREDPELEPLLDPVGVVSQRVSPVRSAAVVQPDGSTEASALPPRSGAALGHSSERSALERAIGGRFELPSLDLAADAGAPSVDESNASLGTLKPTPRGPQQTVHTPVVDDPAVASAALAGPAAVVRQRVDARLELAAAYMDLGDEPRARRLLAQTLIDGDAQQQETAQRLLNQWVRND